MGIKKKIRTFDLSNQIDMKKVIILIVLCVSTIASAQTAEEIEMTNLINKIRTNPTSFIPVIEAYIASSKQLSFTNKKTGKQIDIVGEGTKLIAFLKNVKAVDSLKVSLVLYPIAKSHAKYVDSTKQIGHTGPNGQLFTDRVKSTGLTCGENVGVGRTATEVMIALLIDLSSPTKGHRTNIFNPNYKQVSVAKVGNIWVQNFAY